ncbi:MAG: hypothetical protein QGH40_14195 [bacterium]|jgi:hypothetical protein|nr:hypothetical protein [bacterium]
MSLSTFILDLDRRWIFLVTLLAVVIPLLNPIGFPVEVNKEVQAVYDFIEQLEEGDRVLFSCEYDPSTKPEVHPMCTSLMYHCFSKKLKVVVIALWPQGAPMADQAFTSTQKIFQEKGIELKRGRDFTNLGYKSGGMVVINRVGAEPQGFIDTFPKNIAGKPVAQLEIMKDIKLVQDFKAVFSFSSGDPGLKQWVMIAHEQFGVPVAGGTTGVSAPEFYPYLQSGQMVGLLGALKGAAEYEHLIGRPGPAMAGMDAQSIVHLLLIVFIILANVTYFMQRRRDRAAGALL